MNNTIRFLLLLAACIPALGAAIQQTTLTTNKMTLGVGLTNLPTAAPTVLSLSISAGTNIVLTTNATGVVSFNVAPTNTGSGDDIWLLHTNITTLNLTNAAANEVTWSGAGTNVWLELAAAIARDAELTAFLTEASAYSLYQKTNTTLTRFAGIGAGTTGDILYHDGVGWTNLAKGVDGKVLELSGGFPSWQTDDVGIGGSGDDVWVNHSDVLNPNFTNASAAEITWTTSGTNVWPVLAAAVTRDSELSLFLTEASAYSLYQATNANLTALASNPQLYQATNAALTALAGNPQLYQATNGNLTLLSAYGPTTWQATNAALTALAGNPQLYQATNDNLTLLSATPTIWQQTNAALTALANDPNLYQSTNTVLTTLASGEAGGLTVAAPAGATNATQLVTLAQLQSASPGGQSSFFDLSQGAAGFGGFTSGTTNLNSLTAVSTVTTNAGVALVAGDYVAFFISTNTYASVSDGLATVSMWCFEASAGSPTIKAEVYLINAVTKQVEYEYEPSPAYQLVPGTKGGLVFSVPVTTRATGTNMHIGFGIKQGASGTVRLVTGGTNNSHGNFPLPNSALVLKSGDTMTGLLSVPALAATSSIKLTAATASKLAVFDGASYLTNSLLTEASITDNLTQAEADDLFQGTNANLTLLQAYGPTTWQATNANLTALAGDPTIYQATNVNLTALAANPQLYQATNAALTALAGNPQLYQATNAALTALAGNPQLYQATNGNLTIWATVSTNSVPALGVGVLTATTVTGATIDSTVNVLKLSGYADFTHPHALDAHGASIIVTNDYTSLAWGHATFPGDHPTNENYVIYQWVVPPDIDTAVDLTAQLWVVGAGTDADDIEFRISMQDTAGGATTTTAAMSYANPIVLAVTPTSPAAADLQVVPAAAATLTGWKAAITAGHLLQICVARHNNSNDDAYSDRMLRINYAKTQ